MFSSHPVVALDRFGLHSDMASSEGAKETTRGREGGREGVYSTFPRMMMSDSSARPVGRTDAQVDDFPARERNSRRARKRRKEVRPASSYPAFTFHCSAPFRSWEGEEATGYIFEKGSDCKPLSVPLQRRGCELAKHHQTVCRNCRSSPTRGAPMYFRPPSPYRIFSLPHELWSVSNFSLPNPECT